MHTVCLYSITFFFIVKRCYFIQFIHWLTTPPRLLNNLDTNCTSLFPPFFFFFFFFLKMSSLEMQQTEVSFVTLLINFLNLFFLKNNRKITVPQINEVKFRNMKPRERSSGNHSSYATLNSILIFDWACFNML